MNAMAMPSSGTLAKRLRVPRLHLGVHLAEEMYVVELNRELLRFVLDELYRSIWTAVPVRKSP